jgi:hypothetical protein
MSNTSAFELPLASLTVDASTFTCQTREMSGSCAPLLVYGVALTPYFWLILQSLIMVLLSTGWALFKPKILPALKTACRTCNKYWKCFLCFKCCTSHTKSSCCLQVERGWRECRQRKRSSCLPMTIPQRHDYDRFTATDLNSLRNFATQYGVTVVSTDSTLSQLIREGFSAENGIGFLQVQVWMNFCHFVYILFSLQPNFHGVDLYGEIASRYMESGYPTLVIQFMSWLLLPMPGVWNVQPSMPIASWTHADLPADPNWSHTYLHPFTGRWLRTWNASDRFWLFAIFLDRNMLLAVLLFAPLLPPLLSHCAWGMMAFFFGPVGIYFLLIALLVFSVRFYSRCSAPVMCVLLVLYRWLFTLFGSVLLRTSYIYGLLLWQYGNPTTQQQWETVEQEVCLRDAVCYVEALTVEIKTRLAFSSLFT